MLSYLREKWQAARLKARYERIVQERLLKLIESHSPQPVSEDAAGWIPLGGGKTDWNTLDARTLRENARQLVACNPHARNVLRLLEIYVVGPGLRLGHLPAPTRPANETPPLWQEADRLWNAFLRFNARHFSYREFARRTWRDGECFLRLFPREDGPPAVRFLDPERIDAPADFPDSQGILTSAVDVETPTAYLKIDPQTGRLAERIAPERLIHTRINADSNQKRGTSLFAPLMDALKRYEQWLDTELVARKLQASIVLWRRVQGSPAQVARLADALETAPATGSGDVRTERYRAGTILTTSYGTELKFLQPDTNFDDAVPLGRSLLLCAAAGAGLPEFMLTGDASNANYSSTLVAEGPAVKLFQSEQQFFAGEFNRLWRRVMQEAVQQGQLPDDVFDRIVPQWSFPKLVTRDRPREREADVKLVESQILSRAEIARRDNADPAQMQREILEERQRLGKPEK